MLIQFEWCITIQALLFSALISVTENDDLRLPLASDQARFSCQPIVSFSWCHIMVGCLCENGDENWDLENSPNPRHFGYALQGINTISYLQKRKIIDSDGIWNVPRSGYTATFFNHVHFSDIGSRHQLDFGLAELAWSWWLGLSSEFLWSKTLFLLPNIFEK